MSSLTSQQLAAYERDGFLVIKDFTSATACEKLRARAVELVSEFDPANVRSIFQTHEQTRTSDDYFMESGDKIRFFFEADAFDAAGHLRHSKERSINKIGHALHDLDPIFESFSYTPELKALVHALGISRPLLVQSMYIFKQPLIGGEVTCHQDATFLYTEPLTTIGLWFALEDATQENGCLWALRGAHREGLKSRFGRTPRGGTQFNVMDAQPWAHATLVPLEVSQGTLIVLNSLLPHLSRANTSPKSRHAYTLHVIDAASHYPSENWLQRAPAMPLREFD